jgi:lipoprotein-anchoring transpeptidase ErfK/SrfK
LQWRGSRPHDENKNEAVRIASTRSEVRLAIEKLARWRWVSQRGRVRLPKLELCECDGAELGSKYNGHKRGALRVMKTQITIAAMRGALVLSGLATLTLGGCVQTTLAPAPQVNWSARDRQLLANVPYAQARIPEDYQRHIVEYHRKEMPGTIVVDTNNRFLYYILPQGKAIRYGVTVGEAGLAWSGVATVGRKEEWPAWVPTEEIKHRLPVPNYVNGGAHNPMGARALYLYQGDKDTLYRIHGTNQPEYIGRAISSGCIRMTNEDAIDLYDRVKIGAPVVVLPLGQGV